MFVRALLFFLKQFYSFFLLDKNPNQMKTKRSPEVRRLLTFDLDHKNNRLIVNPSLISQS